MSDRCYSFDFVVQGYGRFPYDMLRRDACYPAAETESHKLGYSSERRSVKLRYNGPNKWWTPTLGRWESFGWRVIEIEGESVPERANDR